MSTRPQPGDGFFWTEAPAGPALACGPLATLAVHLFTTRGWALGSPAPHEEAAWDEVARAMGVDREHLVRVHQVHGDGLVVRRAGAPLAAGPLADADIIVSDDPSVALAVQAADCIPLLLADPATGAVAAAHAGWRGLAARVPCVAVEALLREFGAAASDLVAAVGPSISLARYDVGADVRRRFEAGGFPADALERWFVAASRPDHWLFDGWQAARDQLIDAGVRADRLHVAALCTASHPDLLCSHRRDRAAAGRIAGAIRARPRAGDPRTDAI